MSMIQGEARIRLRVALLGRLGAQTPEGRPVRVPGRHAQALFALLVLARRPRSREAIAADLWPDADGGSAGSLRQALWLVRQGLIEADIEPERLLDIDADTVGIRMEACIDLDVTAFEHCLSDMARGAEAAVERYHGDLLEGLGHECFAAERERLSDRFEDALAVVAQQRLAACDPLGAHAAAERLLARDPLREEAHAVIIAVHGLMGTRSQVIRQYRRLRDVLHRELGETPLPDTEAIYRQALARTLERARERAAAIEPAGQPVLVAVGR
jgi:DNA-binding SARP family transcriptional activator